MAWEEWSMSGGDAAAEVGRGRVAKGFECREERGSQGGVLHTGGHGGVWRHVEWFKAETLDFGNLGSNPVLLPTSL